MDSTIFLVNLLWLVDKVAEYEVDITFIDGSTNHAYAGSIIDVNKDLPLLGGRVTIIWRLRGSPFDILKTSSCNRFAMM